MLERLGLIAANRNGAGQTVVAGPLDALAAAGRGAAGQGAASSARRSPARSTPRRWSRPAQALAGGRHRLVGQRSAARACCPTPTAAVVSTGAEKLARLVAQVAAPVRWDLCQQTMAELGVTALLELAPGGTLTGLAKRTLPGVETFAVKTPDDLRGCPRAARVAQRRRS